MKFFNLSLLFLIESVIAGLITDDMLATDLANSKQHPCQQHECQGDEYCVELIVQCFKAPCYPIPICQK